MRMPPNRCGTLTFIALSNTSRLGAASPRHRPSLEHLRVVAPPPPYSGIPNTCVCLLAVTLLIVSVPYTIAQQAGTRDEGRADAGGKAESGGRRRIRS